MGHSIDLEECEDFIRQMCKVNNIVQLAYDPYQMASMTQKLVKDGIVWCEPFTQSSDRLKSDSQLYDLIVGRRIHYSHDSGCPKGSQCSCMMMPMRQHIANSNAKMQTNEDSKLRIVKKANGAKIDLAVSLSMASARALYLRISGNI
jgi:phage terminase large subunit-like protein